MKKILLSIFMFIGILFTSVSFAEDKETSWTIVPEGSPGAANAVGQTPGKVWDNYNKAAGSDPGDAFASGVFSWDSIFGFFKYLAHFLSQIGLVVAAAMIIYAGYKYATGVFTGNATKGGAEAIKLAIFGLLIVIFSYAIVKLLISTFL